MTHRSYSCASAIFTLLFAPLAFGQNAGQLPSGNYRLEGECSRTLYLGAEVAPECDHFLGIKVDVSDKPMFIFPLKNGARAWFFVASQQESSSKDRTVYAVEKLYDQALNVEFSYPAGECEVNTGPIVRCTVWKDPERTVKARELVFSGSGNWARAK